MRAERTRRRASAPAALAAPSAAPGWLPPALIALAALAAYANSFSGPFVLDDGPSIAGNPSIRHLWPLSGPLAPPAGFGLTVEGRPLVNLSLAFNYALSGLHPWSYHALNLLIHLLAGLTLFGVIRRTLAKVNGMASAASAAALATALLWTAHPLQTESVTYIAQRSESLMGLCYLLTLYGFIRLSAGGKGRRGWATVSILSCLGGMAAKEVMVSAPLVVLLYDRTFVSGSFRAAWRRHGRFFLGLAATWIVLGLLVIREGSRGGTSGFGVGVSAPAYWLSQLPALVRYLQLAAWPINLVFDYGTEWVSRVGEVIPAALLVSALAAATGWALLGSVQSEAAAQPAAWRRAAGFAGVWFFAILAPTSLVPGNRQTLAEHRMYLALAPLLATAVVASFWWLRRWAFPGWRSAVALAVAAAILLFCGLTARRNRDYRSELALFADTAAKRPRNAYARANYGTALLAAGRPEAAVGQFEAALRLRPAYPIAEDDLGNALLELGRTAEAIAHYRAALKFDPGLADAHNNLGGALARLGRLAEAEAEIRAALRLQPDDAEAHNNLGGILAGTNRLDLAVEQFREALRLDPNYVAARRNLLKALRQAQPAAPARGVGVGEQP